MSEQSGSGVGGFIGALLMGVGITSAVLLPFYLIWRYGVAHVALVMAPITTVIAIYRLDWLAHMGDYAGEMTRLFLSMPWTAISIVAWAFYALCLIAVVMNALPSALAGRSAQK